MKKVAILTTHRANNFGAMLQAYSLTMFCREQGVDAEIFDWRTPLFERDYHSAWRFSRNPFRILRYLYWYWYDERGARRRFNAFRKLLPISCPYVKSSQLARAEEKYDAFIVGSDQVWRPSQTAPSNPEKFDRTYLLNFVQRKPKYAYADSLGNAAIQPESLLPEYVSAWKTYAGISMRERSGAEFIARHLGRKIPTVVDPVFLHDASFWRRLKSNEAFGEHYVLIYNVQHYRAEARWMIKKAYEYAELIGAKVYNLLVPSAPESKIRCDNLSVGPCEFLKLIDEADAVFTNSFHATAFSVLFGKKLFLHKANASGTANSRFDFLSGYYGMRLKEISREGDERIFYLDCLVDSEKLKILRLESQQLLCSWIDKIKEG